MPKQPTMLLCAVAGAVTAAILCGWMSDVSAQDCNDRYPCQAFGRPPLQGTQPLPVTPQVFAPYGAQEPEPMMPPGGPRAFPQAVDPALPGRYASLYAGRRRRAVSDSGGGPQPDRSAVPAPDRLLPDERAARDHRDRSGKPLPLSGAGRRTGDPLRRRRRARRASAGPGPPTCARNGNGPTGIRPRR